MRPLVISTIGQSSLFEAPLNLTSTLAQHELKHPILRPRTSQFFQSSKDLAAHSGIPARVVPPASEADQLSEVAAILGMVTTMDFSMTVTHIVTDTATMRISPLPTNKRQIEKKPLLACLFCRGRKIACGVPLSGSVDKTCK